MSNRTIQFHKMEGAGNDFIVIDNYDRKFSEDEVIRITPSLCHRKYGIGADGLISIEKSEDDDYTMFYRNADGSDAGMCGNGARCAALFAYSKGFGKIQSINVHGNRYTAKITAENEVAVDFPVEADIERLEDRDGSVLFKTKPGTEHVTKEVDEELLKNEGWLKREGKRLRHDQKFQPAGTNVNFLCGTNRKQLNLQTYERGVEDITLACGTGAIAAALTWHHIQNEKEGKHEYTVQTEGGTLKVSFTYRKNVHKYQHITLKGPAHFVFEGTYKI